MDTQPAEKRGRGRPRKNPLPTIVAKSTIIRRTVPTENDGTDTEVLHSSIDFVGDNAVPVVRSALNPETSAAAEPETSNDIGDGSAAPQIRRRGRPPKEKSEIQLPTVPAVLPIVSEGTLPAGFKGPGVRLGKEIQVGDSRLSFFYIVFKNPEHDDLLYPDTMHSIQHLLSAAAKEADLPNIVKIMPCGSRIAMEVAVLDAQSDFSKHELRKLMLTAAYMDNIPEDELLHCSNPRYQNFVDAHREICEFIDSMYGITMDSRTGDYSW